MKELYRIYHYCIRKHGNKSFSVYSYHYLMKTFTTYEKAKEFLDKYILITPEYTLDRLKASAIK